MSLPPKFRDLAPPLLAEVDVGKEEVVTLNTTAFKITTNIVQKNKIPCSSLQIRDYCLKQSIAIFPMMVFLPVAPLGQLGQRCTGKGILFLFIPTVLSHGPYASDISTNSSCIQANKSYKTIVTSTVDKTTD